ncbi:MAG TPA: ABC transporter ATP-binding protein [Patescibacteria group bacterium]|nr:ABC transporter ATP-binding protein [Patescibacteria group bacterium]
MKPAEPHRSGLLRRFYGTFVRPYLALQAEIAFCLLVGVVLSLIDPLILRAIIDRALGDGDRAALLALTGLLVLVFLFRAAFRLLSTYLYSYSGLRILFDVRQKAFEHAQRLSPYFFRRERLGDLLSRLTSDVDALQQAAAHTAVNAASDALTLAGIAILLCWLDPLLAGLMALAFVPLIVAMKRVNRGLRVEGSRAREAYGGMFAFIEERLAGVRLVQEHNRQKAEARGHVRAARPVIESNMRLSMTGSAQTALADLVNTVCLVIIFAVGGLRALSGSLSVGSLVAYYTLASRLYKPLTGLIEVNVQIQVARASLARLFDLFDSAPQVRDDPRAKAPARIRGEVTLSRVGLAWDQGTRVLDGVDLEISAGQVVALVGRTGSGKSTLAAMLSRYLDATQGDIHLDGVSVRAWPLPTLRAAVGLVPQETQLFHDTLAANLRLARRRATDAELLDALEAAGLAQFVRDLPRGLDTTVGEQGLRLSGGERQRLALARVLLKDPWLFVLDEATSALDPQTERLVLDRFRARVRGRSVLIIGHRLTSLTDVDRIFVLDSGRIVESGLHADLYRARGLYRSLYDDQLRHDVEAEA